MSSLWMFPALIVVILTGFPVALTMMAVNQLGPATVRTATNGKSLKVEVADERVAQIFRAALEEMQKTRSTDRLVDIVVAGAAGGR